MSEEEEKSQSGEAAAAPEDAENAQTSDDPFADPFAAGDLDFEEAAARRERALAARRAREAEEAANGGGGGDDDGDIQVIKIGSLFDDDPLPVPVRQTPTRTTTIDRSSRDIESDDSDEEDPDEVAARLAAEEAERKRIQREREITIQVGENKTLTKWPYDHYHIVQEEYWRKYFEREEAAKIKQEQAGENGSDSSTSVSITSSDEDDDDDESSSSEGSSSSSEEESSSSEGSEDSEERMARKARERRLKKKRDRRERKIAEKKRLKRLNRDTVKEQEKRRKLRQKAMEEERQSGLHDLKSDILVFERPQDPPDIKQAVRDLPLTEFESVAKERAIAMISTWLFDAGLVQELMQTKKVSGDGTTTREEEETKKKEKKVQIKITLPGDKDKKKDKDKRNAQDQGPRRTKMDIEIEKLEKTVRLQLDVINIRLKKGVATSGNEVQELVNSVVNAKSELVKLRQTSSVLSTAGGTFDTVSGMATHQTTFAINKYPHLKYAINARKNLQKCFRELTFFSQIPENCAHLVDMLLGAEWSEKEWVTLRTVCREHVELEIFLLEAEAGMRKQQADEEEDGDDDDAAKKQRRRSSMGAGFKRASFDVGLPHNNDEVDRFLKEHVQNVYELGDEIRMKIQSGMSDAFEIAYDNPAGMVALVEAVEIYENANSEYQAIHGNDLADGKIPVKSLRFINIRATALGRLYRDMRERGEAMFEGLVESIDKNEEDHVNKEFSAILRGANDLSSEVTFVAEQMAPCFPSYWSLETVWTSCVAELCAEQIQDRIKDEDAFAILGMPQLLDMVAWVENFKELVEESFPDVASLVSPKRTYFEATPLLLSKSNDTVTGQRAKDTLAFVNNILWDAHKNAMTEFIFRTREQAVELLERFYKADHDKRQTSDDLLQTSLCGDIYGFIGLQVKTLRERLTRKSVAMIQLVGVIFKALYDAQRAHRDHFLVDFECCCAGANDFVQMGEKCEDIIFEIRTECHLSPKESETLDNQAGALLGLYTSDAVYAAQKISVFVFKDIYESEEITPLFFSVAWLDEMPDNDVAGDVVITITDYFTDIQDYLDDIMIIKALQALVTKCVVYYIEQLLDRATKHKSGRDSYFADNKRALERMEGDIEVMKGYFDEIADQEDNRPLKEYIFKEFEIFETYHAVMSIACGVSDEDIRRYLWAFQDYLKSYDMTHAIVGDLYHLVNPGEEATISQQMEEMKDDLMTEDLKDEKEEDEHGTVPGLNLKHMLKKHIRESKDKRSRPGEGGVSSWFGIGK
ncbi:Exocyst complex component [Seminavis robusta]|uniref:Exocyst complex component n=1 Tax=Seminavis robusta TaxID=568900 RepID=A0A9N8H9Y7_9STRA|nr:Exocyst complex component [Seminavis robusta]|eukprot:Sro207_g086930.1 Exocyst complex component (1263) ;mRNA; r:67791-72001